MRSEPFTSECRSQLLDIAQQSIRHGLQHGRADNVTPDEFPDRLQEPGSSFVTLRIGPKLRGCMGSMSATRSLVDDVAINAFSAAFRDPRFPPVESEEFADLTVSISVLDTPRPVAVESERQLLQILSANRGGWIVHHGNERGLLLPSVWDTLPEAAKFLSALKSKANLPRDFWSERLRFETFNTQSFNRDATSRG